MTVSLLRIRRFAPLLLAAQIVAWQGCRQEDEPVFREAAFEAEGTLDFVRPNGEPFLRIAVELAETRDEQTRGLMGRRSLPSRGGMLFVYPAEVEQSFWMKNTPLPLDILFIGADSSIVNIVRRTKPLSEDHITSTGPAQYVLEVRAGFVDRHGIDKSTRIRWHRLEKE